MFFIQIFNLLLIMFTMIMDSLKIAKTELVIIWNKYEQFTK